VRVSAQSITSRASPDVLRHRASSSGQDRVGSWPEPASLGRRQTSGQYTSATARLAGRKRDLLGVERHGEK
jgi:hypothetical protein